MMKPRPTVAVDSPAFRNQLSTSLPDDITTNNKYELDETINAITNTIAHEKARATTYINPDNYIQHLNPEILNLISKKKKKQKKKQNKKKNIRKRSQGYRQRDDKTELNYLTKKIHNLIQVCRTQQFDKTIAHAIRSNQIWKITSDSNPTNPLLPP